MWCADGHTSECGLESSKGMGWGCFHLPSGSSPASGREGSVPIRLFSHLSQRQAFTSCESQHHWLISLPSTVATTKEMDLLFLSLPNKLKINVHVLDICLLIGHCHFLFFTYILFSNCSTSPTCLFEQKDRGLPLWYNTPVLSSELDI